jgi:hypothetical protein
MKVKMKTVEVKCNEQRERLKKNWEFYTIAGDAYLKGFKDCVDMLTELLAHDNNALTALYHVGQQVVEMEFKDGSHQIGAKMSDKEQETTA